jgi:AcrR family transcriptional regulator
VPGVNKVSDRVSSAGTLADVALARSTKRQAVEAAVLRATEELLEEGNAFAELNVERIATRAGIGRTAFYFYFHDKRELLMRLTSDVSEQLYAVASRWFAGDDDELVSALREIGELYREHAALLRVIVEVSTYDDEVAGRWRALLGRFVDASRRRIEREQAAGRAVATDAHATAFALCWMTERTMYQHLVQGAPLPLGDMVDAMAGIWLRAVYGT